MVYARKLMIYPQEAGEKKRIDKNLSNLDKMTGKIVFPA